MSMAKLSMERCRLKDSPYEILFEIFRRLSKSQLFGISRLCSYFRGVAGDTRLWKDVYIEYEIDIVDIDELYSEPWRLKIIDLPFTKINPPLSPQTDRTVKVAILDLTSITADEVTIEAILAEYQCTELYLNKNNYVCFKGIEPEAFSRQDQYKVLSVRALGHTSSCRWRWLAKVLTCCKNLKTLDVSCMGLTNSVMLGLVKKFPTSLEKLFLGFIYPGDDFFKLLAGTCPNLRELELSGLVVKCPSLIKLQFLEILHIVPFGTQDVGDFDMYLEKFTALKTVNILLNERNERNLESPYNMSVQKLRTTLKPYGIIVGVLEYFTPYSYPS